MKLSYPYLHRINNPPKQVVQLLVEPAVVEGLPSAPLSLREAPLWRGGVVVATDDGALACRARGPDGEVMLVFTGMPETNCILRKTGETETLQAVARTILIKGSDGRVYQRKSNLKIEIDGISVSSANWRIRPLQQLSESLSLLQHSWFLFPELDLLACLLSKGLFLIFLELYLKCVFFWLLMFSFLHSGSQAGAQVLIPGPQIYSHRFDGLSLVLPVSQSTWMGRLQTFAGTAVSAVETILLAVEAQFRWGGAHISCLKRVKPHQSSVIRPAGIFFPLTLFLVHLLSLL